MFMQIRRETVEMPGNPGSRSFMNDRQSCNLLEMIPRRTHDWTDASDGKVKVLVPRYGKTRLGRWAAAKIGRPYIFVNLDEVGSAIWRACDGESSVGQIGEQVRQEYGEKVAPLGERMARFFKEMEHTALIRWRAE